VRDTDRTIPVLEEERGSILTFSLIALLCSRSSRPWPLFVCGTPGWGHKPGETACGIGPEILLIARALAGRPALRYKSGKEGHPIMAARVTVDPPAVSPGISWREIGAEAVPTANNEAGGD
jgi:hypothetical protein